MNTKLHKTITISFSCYILSAFTIHTANASGIVAAISKTAEMAAKAAKESAPAKSQNSDCLIQCDSNQKVQSAINQFTNDMAKQGSLTAGKTPEEIQTDIQDLARSTVAVGEAYKVCTDACAGAPGPATTSDSEAEKIPREGIMGQQQDTSGAAGNLARQ